MKLVTFMLLALSCLSSTAFGQTQPFDLDDAMRFSGTAKSVQGIELVLSIVLTETPAGEWVGQIDIPRLNISALALVNIAGDANSIRAEVPLGRLPAQIEATLDEKRTTLSGSFKQRGIELTFDLARVEDVKQVPEAKKPQFPEWAKSSWLIRRHFDEPWALVDGNVIDVITGEIHTDMTIVIVGDLIESINSDPPAEGMHVVDISGQYVVPGFFDLHAHVIPKSDLFPAAKGPEATLLDLLEAGVTTIRCLPMISENPQVWASQINSGDLVGPTIVSSSSIIEKERQRTSYGFGNPATARAWVRKEALLGNRWIKVYNKMDAQSLQAIVETAAEYGMKVCGHTEDVPPLEASKIGMQCVEHMVSIPLSCLADGVDLADEPGGLGAKIAWRWTNYDPAKGERLMQAFKANDTAWVPTLTVTEAIIKGGSHDGVAFSGEHVKEQLQKALIDSAKLVVRLHEIGGLVGVGTDFPVDGVVAGESVHRELELIVEFGGATPLQALQMATISSAKILGFDDLLGTVEPGKLANLVVLKHNPLDDISNTRKISMVVHDGRIHQNSAENN